MNTIEAVKSPNMLRGPEAQELRDNGFYKIDRILRTVADDWGRPVCDQLDWGRINLKNGEVFLRNSVATVREILHRNETYVGTATVLAILEYNESSYTGPNAILAYNLPEEAADQLLGHFCGRKGTTVDKLIHSDGWKKWDYYNNDYGYHAAAAGKWPGISFELTRTAGDTDRYGINVHFSVDRLVSELDKPLLAMSGPSARKPRFVPKDVRFYYGFGPAYPHTLNRGYIIQPTIDDIKWAEISLEIKGILNKTDSRGLRSLNTEKLREVAAGAGIDFDEMQRNIPILGRKRMIDRMLKLTGRERTVNARLAEKIPVYGKVDTQDPIAKGRKELLEQFEPILRDIAGIYLDERELIGELGVTAPASIYYVDFAFVGSHEIRKNVDPKWSYALIALEWDQNIYAVPGSKAYVKRIYFEPGAHDVRGDTMVYIGAGSYDEYQEPVVIQTYKSDWKEESADRIHKVMTSGKLEDRKFDPRTGLDGQSHYTTRGGPKYYPSYAPSSGTPRTEEVKETKKGDGEKPEKKVESKPQSVKPDKVVYVPVPPAPRFPFQVFPKPGPTPGGRRDSDHGFIDEPPGPGRRELDHGFMDIEPPESPFPHE